MFITKQRVQKFAAATFFPLLILAAAAHASAVPYVAPYVSQMNKAGLSYELVASFFGTVGSCGVGANVSFFSALGEALPGISYYMKAMASGSPGERNEVIESAAENKNWLGTFTAYSGSILSIPADLVADAQDYIVGGNTGHRAGAGIRHGFSATTQIGRDYVGKDSSCRRYSDRLVTVVYEMAYRHSNPNYVVRSNDDRHGTIVRTQPAPAPAPSYPPPEAKAPAEQQPPVQAVPTYPPSDAMKPAPPADQQPAPPAVEPPATPPADQQPAPEQAAPVEPPVQG
jgi:hypothetical protein